MSEMVEQVAKEICAADGSDWEAEGTAGRQGLYLMGARAAIEAMRVPTVEMYRAGVEAGEKAAISDSQTLVRWRAMIDAALARENA